MISTSQSLLYPSINAYSPRSLLSSLCLGKLPLTILVLPHLPQGKMNMLAFESCHLEHFKDPYRVIAI